MSILYKTINIVFTKTDNSPISEEDIDYIYEHLDRDCLVMQNPFQKNQAIVDQEDVTWSRWKEDLQEFCANTEGFSVYARVCDEFDNQDVFSKKSSGKTNEPDNKLKDAYIAGTKEAAARLDAYLRSKLKEVDGLGYMDNFHSGFRECLLEAAEEFLKVNLR